MQSKNKDIFWQLIRLGLWKEAEAAELLEQISKLSDEDWAEIYNAALMVQLDGILMEAIQKLPREDWPQQSVVDKMIMRHFAFERSHNLNNATIVEIFGKLREIGCKPILLKGQSLPKYFENPLSRSCGDIDIFIGDVDFENKVNKVADIGVAKWEDIEFDGKHASFPYKGCYIELHKFTAIFHNTSTNHKYQKIVKKSITDAEKIEVEPLLELPSTLNAFYLFYHLYYHFIAEGPQVKQFADLSRFLYKNYDKIDQEELLSILNSLKLLDEWQKVGCFLVEFFGLQKEKFPFYNQAKVKFAPMIKKVIEAECLDNKKSNRLSKRPDGYLRGKWYSFREQMKQQLNVFHVFPSQNFVYRLLYFLKRGIKLTLTHKQRALIQIRRI